MLQKYGLFRNSRLLKRAIEIQGGHRRLAIGGQLRRQRLLFSDKSSMGRHGGHPSKLDIVALLMEG